MKRFAVTGLVSGLLLPAACVAGGQGSQTTTGRTTASIGPTRDDEAAAAFIAAWSRGDSDAMRQFGDGTAGNEIGFGGAPL